MTPARQFDALDTSKMKEIDAEARQHRVVQIWKERLTLPAITIELGSDGPVRMLRGNHEQ
ncbi:hypothetical protein CKO20_05995 [Rhodocyclus tenuis]|nr:hypothetical protein [Rhodocyclus tenuis]